MNIFWNHPFHKHAWTGDWQHLLTSSPGSVAIRHKDMTDREFESCSGLNCFQALTLLRLIKFIQASDKKSDVSVTFWRHCQAKLN